LAWKFGTNRRNSNNPAGNNRQKKENFPVKIIGGWGGGKSSLR
jgi:hypothetical protein